MKNQPHIDRRHVKEMLQKDELSEWLMHGRDWVLSHLETVVIGVLVVAAVIFGVVFFINGQAQKDLDASKLLNEAHQIFQQAANVPAEQTQAAFGQAYAKFQAVASTYEGTPQALDAHLGMANAQFAMAKYADAEREYGALDSGDAKDPIAALAAFGKGRALEAEGKAADALTVYQAVVTHYPAGPTKALAEVAAKRLGSPANPGNSGLKAPSKP